MKCGNLFAGLGLFLLAAAPVFTQDLTISLEDTRIEQRVDGGFHLFIRKKPDIYSVLLTETTRDPAMMEDNYAYRAQERNNVNGDELRILNGTPLTGTNGQYSLIDSTSEIHPELGEAFHIYIPYILYYGYSDTRHGEIYVADGTFLNIRAFGMPYADYRGGFRDNPYLLSVVQAPLEGPPEGNYMRDTEEAFKEIATDGNLVYSRGPEDLVDRIHDILEQEQGKSLDFVICLDTTSSMKDDIDAVRRLLIPMIEGIIAEFKDLRIGLVLYKDYYDEYLTRTIPFTRDFASVRRNLNNIRAAGGRDIPEAVYEALYDAAVRYPWQAESKLIILIGDAPPHPRPRGSITREMVDLEIANRDIKVQAIILPQ
jgi:hypothetical protein